MGGAPTRRRKWLRHRQDLHCLLFHWLTLLGYGCAFFLYLHPEHAHIGSLASRIAFVLAAGIMLGWCSGIDVAVNFHNHAHRPFFRSPYLNRWCGRLWTFSSGWPSFCFEHAHVTVHHGNLLRGQDWTLPRRRPDGRFESLLRYTLLHWPWRFGLHCYRDFTEPGRMPSGAGKRARWELALFAALWSIPFWIDIEMALTLWLFPQWLGNMAVSGAGMYTQHAGCVRPSAETSHSHSNSSLSAFHNLTMFNLGYHLAHHTHPTVHWIDLPRVHARLLAKLEAKAPRGDRRIFAASYYKIGSLLARSWLSDDHRDRLPRWHGEGAAEQAVRFELATEADYHTWHRETQSAGRDPERSSASASTRAGVGSE
jgi:fatty acid desaturase